MDYEDPEDNYELCHAVSVVMRLLDYWKNFYGLIKLGTSVD